MGEEKQFIFRIVSETQGIQKSIQDMKQLETQAKTTASNLSKTSSGLIIPSGAATGYQHTFGFSTGGGKLGGNFGKPPTTFASMGGQGEWDFSGKKKGFEEVFLPIKNVNKGLEDLSKNSKSAEIDIGKLASRAMVTIPIWLALRSAFMGVISTITEGTKMIIDMDRELARISTVTTDVSDMTKFLGELGSKARQMSMETGASVEDILHAFYGFKDAGLATEVAFAGMNVAVKGSIALFGDIKETAKTLTDVYVMLGDRITGATTAQGKMELIMSSIAVLQRTNKFELNEYVEGLKTFASAAGTSNLTLDQMTFLLAKAHNFMQRGSRGGTELARAFRDLSKNAQATGLFLGKAIDLNTISKFDLMLLVMDRLNEKMAAGIDITQDINKIFGVIGTRAVGAFVLNLKSLTQQWKEFSSLSPERRMEILNDQFNTATLTLERQAARLQKIREQAGAYLVSGFLGIDLDKTKDAAENFKKINDELEKLVPTLNEVGKAAGPLITLLTLIATIKGAGMAIAAIKAHPVVAAATTLAFVAGRSSTGVMEGIKDAKTTSQSDQYKAYLRSGGKLGPGIYRESVKAGNKTDLGGIELEPLKELEKTQENITVSLKEQQGIVEDISSFYDYQSASLDRLKLFGFDEVSIEKARLELMLKSTDLNDRDKQIHAQKIKIMQAENAELVKYSDELKTSISSGLKGFLKGETSTKDLFKSVTEGMMDQYYGAMSEGLTNRLFGTTGLGEGWGTFLSGMKGTLSGTSNNPIASRIDTTNQKLDTINQSINNKGLLNSVGSDIPSSSNTGSTSMSGSISNVIGKTLGLKGYSAPGGGYYTGQTVTYGGKTYRQTTDLPVAKDNSTIKNIGNLASAAFAYSQSGNSGLGHYLAAAELGYSSVGMISKGGGTSSLLGYAGIIGAGINESYGNGNRIDWTQNASLSKNEQMVAMMQTAGGNKFGNFGNWQAREWGGKEAQGFWNVFDAGGAVSQTISTIYNWFKKTKETTSTSTVQEEQVASKIDTTNKNLEIINRNLIALKSSMETFVLPQSAYFSENFNMSAEWAIYSKRGFQG